MKVKILEAVGVLILIGFAALVSYGVKTDCPNTALYVYCGEERLH